MMTLSVLFWTFMLEYRMMVRDTLMFRNLLFLFIKSCKGTLVLK